MTDDPGIDPKVVAPVLKEAVAYAESKGITINWRPAQSYEHLEKYYTPDEPLNGQCFYPYFGGRVAYDGKVHFCPFIRVEMGDVRKQSLEEIWNGPKFVGLRKKLLEHGIFPVCRRCCKVELTDARAPRPKRSRLRARASLIPDAFEPNAVYGEERLAGNSLSGSEF